MEGAGEPVAVDAGDSALAQASGDAGGGREKRTEKDREVGIVADDEDVVVFLEAADEVVEFRDPGFGREGVGDLDFAVVPGFVGDQRGGLQSALEGAGGDSVELHVEAAQELADENRLLLAFLIEGAFYVNNGIGAARAGAGVAKDVEIHG